MKVTRLKDETLDWEVTKAERFAGLLDVVSFPDHQDWLCFDLINCKTGELASVTGFLQVFTGSYCPVHGAQGEKRCKGCIELRKIDEETRSRKRRS